MDNIVPVIARAKTDDQKEFVEDLLESFLHDEGMSAEKVLQKYERKFPVRQGDDLEFIEQVLDASQSLYALISGFSVAPLEGYPKLARQVDSSFDRLRSMLSSRIKRIRAIFR